MKLKEMSFADIASLMDITSKLINQGVITEQDKEIEQLYQKTKNELGTRILLLIDNNVKTING